MKTHKEILYIFIDELPKEEQEEFITYLFGSAVPVIDGQEHRLTAYLNDYKRWKDK